MELINYQSFNESYVEGIRENININKERGERYERERIWGKYKNS